MKNRNKFWLVLVAMTGFFSSFCQVVINEVKPGNNTTIELKNTGNTILDVSNWILCSVVNDPNYNNITNDLTIVSGNASALAPQELLVLTGMDLQLNDELGLYVNSGFSQSENIKAYLRWGTTASNGRESVAVEAGLWSTGTSLPTLIEGSSIEFDGDGQTGLRGFKITSSPGIGLETVCSLGTPEGGLVTTVDDKTKVSGVANSPNQLSFYVKNNSSADLSYWYIITDADDNILEWVNSMGADSTKLDLSAAPAGECHIWGWSYKGLADPIVGENISTLNDNVSLTSEKKYIWLR